MAVTHLNSAGQLVDGGYSDPATSAAAVTPSDATVLPLTRALYIGVTGDVVATMNGADVTFKSVPVGILPVCVTKVKAATTAQSIVALY